MIPNINPYVSSILSSEFKVNNLEDLVTLPFQKLRDKKFDNFPLLVDLYNVFSLIKEEKALQGNDFSCLIRTDGVISHEVGICLFLYLKESGHKQFDIINFDDTSCSLSSSNSTWNRALIKVTTNLQEHLGDYNFAIEI